MKSRNATFSLIVVIVFGLIFLLKRWKEPAVREMFNRHPASLTYTNHALCRMNCRHISRQDIAEIIEAGSINFNKSSKANRPCPIVAVQGRTAGGESLRVIFSQCATETKVITCYNLSREFECHCPGDGNK